LVLADRRRVGLALELDRINVRTAGVKMGRNTASEYRAQHVSVYSQISLKNLERSARVITDPPTFEVKVHNDISTGADSICGLLVQKVELMESNLGPAGLQSVFAIPLQAVSTVTSAPDARSAGNQVRPDEASTAGSKHGFS
jgi:hypothetical protein